MTTTKGTKTGKLRENEEIENKSIFHTLINDRVQLWRERSRFIGANFVGQFFFVVTVQWKFYGDKLIEISRVVRRG